MDKMPHDACKYPVLPVLIRSLNHMIGEPIRQASFHSHQTVFIHAEDGTIVRQFALELPKVQQKS